MNPTEALKRSIIRAAESELLPDRVLRFGIRRLLAGRLRITEPERSADEIHRFLERVESGPIALVPDKANAQHYEVPAEFFQFMLGPALKYSSCYWEGATQDLGSAEKNSLDRTCENALLSDGQRVLELGCGWGSLTLHMATRFPNSEIVAVSNSAGQRGYILEKARQAGLKNLEVITADINDFEPQGTFDRVVSVEMFEHLRNHALMLQRIERWLREEGRLLVHIFVTSGHPYLFEDEGEDDWMARNFFSGGVMPSDDLLLRYQNELVVERQWRWSGVHYQRTLEAWLARLDERREQAEGCLARSGEAQPKVAAQRWRMFLMACSELFGYDGGRQWYVSHYRFRKRAESR